jgi:hypothetical protein
MSFSDTTYTIPEHYPRQFSDQFAHQIQQTEGRFVNAGIIDPSWTAKEKVYRDLSQNTWVRDDTRFGATVARESLASFRKAWKKKIHAEPIKFDQWDQALLDHIVLPSSQEMQAMMYGYERARDDLFIEACSEDALGGKDPYNTAIPFPPSQVIPVNAVKPGATAGANLGLTIWKLLLAKQRFENLNINLDREEVCLAVSPDEKLDLALTVEVSPNDVWANLIGDWFKEDARGNAQARLLGIFKVITTTRLPLPATDIRTCYAFCRSAFVVSPASEVKSSMDRVPTQRNMLLIQGSAMVGIGRRYDERIIAIPCDRSP